MTSENTRTYVNARRSYARINGVQHSSRIEHSKQNSGIQELGVLSDASSSALSVSDAEDVRHHHEERVRKHEDS